MIKVNLNAGDTVRVQLLMVVVLLIAAVASRAAPPSVLGAAERELALLTEQRDALERTKEELAAMRSARAEALRVSIAELEVKQLALTKAAGDLQRAFEAAKQYASPDLGSSSSPELQRLMVAAQTQAPDRKPVTLADAFAAQLDATQATGQVTRTATGFFSLDGVFHSGAVAHVGGVLAWAASADGKVAGPAWRSDNGFQLLAASGDSSAAAAFVNKDTATAVTTLPVALGGPVPVEALAASEGLVTRTRRLGVQAFWPALLFVLAAVAASWRVVRLLGTKHELAKPADAVIDMLRSQEVERAHQLSRGLRSLAAAPVRAVVERVWGHADPGQIEARAQDAFLDAVEHLRRGQLLSVALWLGGLVTACLSTLGLMREVLQNGMPLNAATLLEAVTPLEIGLVCGAPVLLGVVFAFALAESTRNRLDRVLLRLVDAVLHRPGDTQPPTSAGHAP